MSSTLLFVLVFGLPGAVFGCDLAEWITLSPPRIAVSYAVSGGRAEPTLACTHLEVEEPPPDPRGPFAIPAPLPTPAASFFEATRHEAWEVSVASLRKLQRKLFISATAYDVEDPDRQWEGLHEGASREDSGGKLTVAGGLVQGGLTVGLGTGIAGATVGQVVGGEAGYLDLNPFQDVSAQFDFLIRTDPTQQQGGRAFVLRIRAAYRGAFNGVGTPPSEEAHTDSELTVSIGVVW